MFSTNNILFNTNDILQHIIPVQVKKTEILAPGINLFSIQSKDIELSFSGGRRRLFGFQVVNLLYFQSSQAYIQ